VIDGYIGCCTSADCVANVVLIQSFPDNLLQESSSAASDGNGAGAVTPLYISKINTVFQLTTVAGFLLHAHSGWPPVALLDVAAIVTTGTTVLSGAAYVQAFRTGQH
jgi:hypothetical protein